MTVLEGEIVQRKMNKFEAEETFKLLDAALTDYESAKGKVKEIIESIIDGEGWTALGFGSFLEACEAKIKPYIDNLPIEQRRSFIGVLAQVGISNRMIAAATGISKSTVDRQLAQIEPVGPRKTLGADGKRRAHPDTPPARRAVTDTSEGARRERMMNGLRATLEEMSDPALTAYVEDTMEVFLEKASPVLLKSLAAQIADALSR